MDPQYYPIEQQEDGSFSIFYTGTAPTPVIIKIIPYFDISMSGIEISGLSEESIIISMFMHDSENVQVQVLDDLMIDGQPGLQLSANDILIIDGEKGTFELNSESIVAQVSAPQFPYLKPGENKITITPVGSLGIEIKYKVRYI